MREVCQSGSEGRASHINGTFLPLFRTETSALQLSYLCTWIKRIDIRPDYLPGC